MTRVVWTESALADIQAIQGFVSRDCARYADLLVGRIVGAVGRRSRGRDGGRVGRQTEVEEDSSYRLRRETLSMLGGIVGDDAVQKAIREYAATWAFKHPSPWDFAWSLNRSLGQDLGWFWHAWRCTTDSVDGSIQGARW